MPIPHTDKKILFVAQIKEITIHSIYHREIHCLVLNQKKNNNAIHIYIYMAFTCFVTVLFMAVFMLFWPTILTESVNVLFRRAGENAH